MEKWNFININFIFSLAFIAHFNGKHISLLSRELPSLSVFFLCTDETVVLYFVLSAGAGAL